MAGRSKSGMNNFIASLCGLENPGDLVPRQPASHTLDIKFLFVNQRWLP
jgi:hypothetical protein